MAGLLAGSAVVAVLGGLIAAVAIGTLVLVLGRSPQGAMSQVEADLVRARVDAAALRTDANSADGQAAAARAEWRAWLASHELDASGDDPAAVAALLDALRDRREARARVESLLGQAKIARDAVEAWVVRLVDVVRRFDSSAGQLLDPAAAVELAARAKSAVERASATADERDGLSRQLVEASRERERLDRAADGLRAVVAEVSAAHEIEPESAALLLAAMRDVAGQDLADAQAEAQRILTARDELRGKLDGEGRDDRMARARQDMEGLKAQAADAAERYVIGSLAARLVDAARERYERERQPQVVHTAARIFKLITKGRFVDVRVPLDGSGVSAVTANHTVFDSSELSRGTAEELYVALRVGLIDSLGEQGRWLPVLMDDVVVNFDPERQEGAVAAIGELAAIRQVVFFTCHPATASMLTERVAGSKLLTLGRCRL